MVQLSFGRHHLMFDSRHSRNYAQQLPYCSEEELLLHHKSDYVLMGIDNGYMLRRWNVVTH
jgi:hypothetical protein